MSFETENDYAKAILNYEKFIELSNEEAVNQSIKEKVDYLKKKIELQ